MVWFLDWENTRTKGCRYPVTSDHNDKTCDETAIVACTAARELGATSGREAAGITMGRELTDVEWSEFGSLWTRNWETMLTKEAHEVSSLKPSTPPLQIEDDADYAEFFADGKTDWKIGREGSRWKIKRKNLLTSLFVL